MPGPTIIKLLTSLLIGYFFHASLYAGTILNPPNHLNTQLSVRAYRNAAGPSDTLFPTNLPFSDSHESINVDETSSATYVLHEGKFKIDFSQVGNSARSSAGGTTLRDGANIATSIRFSVDANTPYTVVGYFNAEGQRRKYFSVGLTNGIGAKVYSSVQDSQSQTYSVENFVVGGSDGDTANELIGNDTGTLTAGTLYTFWVDAWIENLHPAPPGTAVGEGSVTLYLGEVPTAPAVRIPTTPILVLMICGLLILAIATARRPRRPNL